MARYISIKTVFIFVAGLTMLGFLFLPMRFDRFSIAADKQSNQKDRLFRKMGILPIPHMTETIEFTLKDLNGDMVRISDYRGKIVFLNFWATWCPDCRIEMPSMQKLNARFNDKAFVMVTINIKESAERVKTFFKKYKLTFIGLLDSDGEVGAQMAIRSIPTTFILGKTGKILGTIMGARKWDSKISYNLFEFLLNQKAGALP